MNFSTKFVVTFAILVLARICKIYLGPYSKSQLELNSSTIWTRS